MNYYKLINGKNFVGVVSQLDFRTYQHKHNVLLSCDESKAQYVQFGDIYYRADWMLPVTTNKIEYEIIKVIQIDEEEYNTLYEAVKKGEVIEPPVEPEETEENPNIDPNDEVTLEFVKNSKLNEISSTCNKVITGGFDVTLSDGGIYHFSLTTQDQLNLTTLSAMVQSGETAIPYHADGELCKFYSSEDIMTIISSATAFKTYQVTYHNALRLYVQSLNTIEEISNIVYGMDIPEDYQSDVLKAIMTKMG